MILFDVITVTWLFISRYATGKGGNMAKIIVIDDSRVVREILSYILENGGHEVILAGTGKEGFECWENSAHIDLILLDHLLPDIMGSAVLKKIRAIDPDAKVIIITGQEINREDYPGINLFLRKKSPECDDPDSADEIIEAVTSVLA